MERKLAKSTTQIDNKRVKVTRWDFSRGAETGWHKHNMNYIVVPLTNGSLDAVLPDGKIIKNNLTVGESYTRTKGTEHNIINTSEGDFSFIEIELK